MRKDFYNRGSDQLVPIHMWVPDSEIQGTEKKILLHPIMEIARKEVLKQFKPTKDIALVSLCTKTRPYRDSKKWKRFIKEIDGYVHYWEENGKQIIYSEPQVWFNVTDFLALGGEVKIGYNSNHSEWKATPALGLKVKI